MSSLQYHLHTWLFTPHFLSFCHFLSSPLSPDRRHVHHLSAVNQLKQSYSLQSPWVYCPGNTNQTGRRSEKDRQITDRHPLHLIYSWKPDWPNKKEKIYVYTVYMYIYICIFSVCQPRIFKLVYCNLHNWLRRFLCRLLMHIKAWWSRMQKNARVILAVAQICCHTSSQNDVSVSWNHLFSAQLERREM